MIRAIRYNTKFVYWTFIIVVIAFVGLIFLQWGMDITGINKPGGNAAGRNADAIAVVNGEELPAAEFLAERREAFRLFRTRTGDDPDEATSDMLEAQIWDAFIGRALLTQALNDNMFNTSSNLLVHVLYNDPPENLRSQFTKDGVFDSYRYREWLREIAGSGDSNREWLEMESYLKTFSIPVEELASILQSSIQVSDLEVRNRFDISERKHDIKLISFGQHDADDLGIEVSPEEVKNYYDTHIDEFMQKEQANLEFAKIPKIVTAEDSLRVHDMVYSIYNRIKDGDDFEALAKRYSDDPKSRAAGGHLGWFGREQMVAPFEEAAFAAEVGKLTQPVLSRFGWHILEVLDTKTDEKRGEMRSARHILVKVEPSGNSMTGFYDKAYAFGEAARALKDSIPGGWSSGTFRSMAEARDIEVVESDYFLYSEGPRAILQKIGFFPEAVEWTFSSEPGEISGVMEHKDFGFFVFHLLDRLPTAPKPFEDVDNSIRGSLRRDMKLAAADSIAAEFDALLAGGAEFEAVAEKFGKVVKDFEVASDSYLPVIGKHPTFIARVFELDKGAVSRAIRLPDRFVTVFAKIIEIHEPDSAVFEEKKDSIRNEIRTEQLGRVFELWLEYEKAASSIEDLRDVTRDEEVLES